jgi:hypothetical protein
MTMMTTLCRVAASRGLVLAGAVLTCLALLTGCPSGTPPGGDGTAPAIGLSPTSLTFTGFEFGTAPADQTIQITNSGVDTLTWSVSDNATWLSVAPLSGTTTTETDEVTVSVSTVGLTAAASPYTAQITVDAAGASNTPQTVNVTLTLSPLTCEALSGTISVNTTLSAPCYIVEGDVNVSGATLTINPGVTLRFQQGRDMNISSTGRLSAVGTASQPILLTGEEPIRGYWGGLRVYQSNSTSNRLDYVTIAYGGGYHDANLYLDGTSSSPARLDITNCTLRESGTYGFSFDPDTVIGAFSGNTITGNTLGAGSVAPEAVGFLDDTSTYTGNDEDVVAVWSGTIYSDQTWPGIDGDYLLTGDVSVGAFLTIDPGARLVFQAGHDMSVNSSGQLSAVGTADEPIVFTGEEQTRGFWGGLRLYQSNSTDNRLDYVTIEYGGGYHDANLYLDGTSSSPARLDITNCTLRESVTYGFSFDPDTIIGAFSGNTITGNTLGAGSVAPEAVGFLDDTSTYTGNDEDVVAVWSGTIYSDQTWPGIDGDYLLTGDVSVGAFLTIDPGARLVFQAGHDMSVNSSGALTAVGTEVNPIVFTGVEQTAGYWGGLRYYQTNSADNRLDYVTIEYGGGYHNANLYLDGTSSSPVQISVTNCTIRFSETWGIYLDVDTNVNPDVGTANTFSNNALGDVNVP